MLRPVAEGAIGAVGITLVAKASITPLFNRYTRMTDMRKELAASLVAAVLSTSIVYSFGWLPLQPLYVLPTIGALAALTFGLSQLRKKPEPAKNPLEDLGDIGPGLQRLEDAIDKGFSEEQLRDLSGPLVGAIRALQPVQYVIDKVKTARPDSIDTYLRKALENDEVNYKESVDGTIAPWTDAAPTHDNLVVLRAALEHLQTELQKKADDLCRQIDERNTRRVRRRLSFGKTESGSDSEDAGVGATTGEPEAAISSTDASAGGGVNRELDLAISDHTVHAAMQILRDAPSDISDDRAFALVRSAAQAVRQFRNEVRNCGDQSVKTVFGMSNARFDSSRWQMPPELSKLDELDLGQEEGAAKRTQELHAILDRMVDQLMEVAHERLIHQSSAEQPAHQAEVRPAASGAVVAPRD